MKTSLNFEHESTKELLIKLDFKYFLSKNIEKGNYSPIDVDKIYSSYKFYMHDLKQKYNQNKKQFYYYSEGQVRKMFTGGLLPALFELDQSRSHRLLDFESVGENWAYFDCWKKVHTRKIKKDKFWKLITRIGSILAFILTTLKLYNIISNES